MLKIRKLIKVTFKVVHVIAALSIYSHATSSVTAWSIPETQFVLVCKVHDEPYLCLHRESCSFLFW